MGRRLQEISRKKPILANRMDIAWENAITEWPPTIPTVASNELRKNFCFTGRGTVYLDAACLWRRFGGESGSKTD